MYEKQSVSLTVSNSNGATGALLKSLTGQSAVSSRKSVTSTCRTSRDVYQIGNRRTGYGVRTTDYCIAVQSTVSSRLLYAYAYYDSLCDSPNPMTPPHHVDVWGVLVQANNSNITHDIRRQAISSEASCSHVKRANVLVK